MTTPRKTGSFVTMTPPGISLSFDVRPAQLVLEKNETFEVAFNDPRMTDQGFSVGERNRARLHVMIDRWLAGQEVDQVVDDPTYDEERMFLSGPEEAYLQGVVDAMNAAKKQIEGGEPLCLKSVLAQKGMF
jgi:hypothetical protein